MRRHRLLVLLAVAVAAAVGTAVVVLASGRGDEREVSRATPAAASPSRFLDMSIPELSIRSYAAAIRAGRLDDACAHEVEAVQKGEIEECRAHLSRMARVASQLRVQIVQVSVNASRATVRYRSTLGFKRGIARLILFGDRWLIANFRPDPTG